MALALNHSLAYSFQMEGKEKNVNREQEITTSFMGTPGEWNRTDDGLLDQSIYRRRFFLPL